VAKQSAKKSTKKAVTKAMANGPSPSTIGRQLRETEQAMTKAQRRVDQLGERLAGITDHAELGVVGTELADAQAALSALEDRWLELAELRDG
jgi:ATP-binding cassette subfamily F protein uup